MKKRTLLIISLFFILPHSSAQDLTCNDFKTGKFRMFDRNAGESIVARNDSVQIEFLPKLKVRVALKVEWVNDCTYKLYFMRFIENPDHIQIPEMILTSEIIETRENSYILRSTSNISDRVMTSEFFKVK